MGECSRKMPHYRCHKEVWALKIKAIETEPPPEFKHPVCRGGFNAGCGHCERCEWLQARVTKWPKTFIVPTEKGYAPIEVSAEFLNKHKPQPGGYYVVYKDGYASFSPAAAFEEGYTLVNE